MSIESIYDDIHEERITLGPHLIQRIWENGFSIDQVLDTILTGTINKQEKDERSQGKFSKYTLQKGRSLLWSKIANQHSFLLQTGGRKRAMP